MFNKLDVFYEKENQSKVSIDLLETFCKQYSDKLHVAPTERTGVNSKKEFLSVDYPTQIQFYLKDGDKPIYKISIGENPSIEKIKRI